MQLKEQLDQILGVRDIKQYYLRLSRILECAAESEPLSLQVFVNKLMMNFFKLPQLENTRLLIVMLGPDWDSIMKGI